MKIHDVEKEIGITKANIRFYEREGLLTPHRSVNGYREYTQEDILRLKQIIILRKLGVSVQQIRAYLEEEMSLQAVLTEVIPTLQCEIDQANGALTLCRQLQAEGAQALDTERYWNILQEQQAQGIPLQNLAEEYFAFVDAHAEKRRELAQEMRANKQAMFILILLGALFSIYVFWAGGWEQLQHLGFQLSLHTFFPYFLGVCMIPAFWMGRKFPKYRKSAEWIIRWLMVITLFILLIKTIAT